MGLRIGTSGYSYKEWKGNFYAEDLKATDMLRYYSERFRSVEINNPFYRMPTAAVLRRWADETPAGFMFVLKAPQRITHRKSLVDVKDDLTYFFDTAYELGPRHAAAGSGRPSGGCAGRAVSGAAVPIRRSLRHRGGLLARGRSIDTPPIAARSSTSLVFRWPSASQASSVPCSW